jgi:hypothetical protein
MKATRRRARDVMVVALSIRVPLGVLAGFRFFILDDGEDARVGTTLAGLLGMFMSGWQTTIARRA